MTEASKLSFTCLPRDEQLPEPFDTVFGFSERQLMAEVASSGMNILGRLGNLRMHLEVITFHLSYCYSLTSILRICIALKIIFVHLDHPKTEIQASTHVANRNATERGDWYLERLEAELVRESLNALRREMNLLVLRLESRQTNLESKLASVRFPV